MPMACNQEPVTVRWRLVAGAAAAISLLSLPLPASAAINVTPGTSQVVVASGQAVPGVAVTATDTEGKPAPGVELGEPPTPCPYGDAVWSWTASITGGPAGPMVSVTPASGSNNATVSLSGATGTGHWQVTVTAKAKYTSQPCNDVIERTGSTVINVYMVGVGKIQFKLPNSVVTENNDGYKDIPADGLYVAAGTVVTFRAIQAPAGAPWPSGKPVWGGTCGATGVGETVQVVLSSPSQSMSDYQTITAECGNTIPGSVVRYGSDVSSLAIDDQSDPTAIYADVTYTLWAKDADLDGRADSLGGTVTLRSLDMADPAAGILVDAKSWSYSNGVPASQRYPIITGIDASTGGTCDCEEARGPENISPNGPTRKLASQKAIAAASLTSDRRLFQPAAASVVIADILKQEGTALAKELLKEALAQLKPGAAQINPPNPSNFKTTLDDGTTAISISLSTRASGSTGVQVNLGVFLMQNPVASVQVIGAPASVTVAGVPNKLTMAAMIWNKPPLMCGSKRWIAATEFDLGVQESGMVANLAKNVGKSHAAGQYFNNMVPGTNPPKMQFRKSKGINEQGVLQYSFTADQDNQLEANQSIVWPS